MAEECIGPDENEKDRFDRAKRINWLDMDAVSAAKILMVGAGAIGNEVGKNLVLSGFRNITIIDMDHVAKSNLARCLFFTDADVAEGGLKANIVAEGMRKLSPGISATAITAKIQEKDERFIEAFFAQVAIIYGILRVWIIGKLDIREDTENKYRVVRIISVGNLFIYK